MGRGRPPLCPNCGKARSVMKGYRYNKGGIVRLRRCLACKRRWTVGPASKGTKPLCARAELLAPQTVCWLGGANGPLLLSSHKSSNIVRRFALCFAVAHCIADSAYHIVNE